jgi:YrbI family 3-deoxy-D-manno-octulosonate 8-phosphate phosphatase
LKYENILRILIIPVRKGSKGIKRKNLQEVNGLSLIKRALNTSLRSEVDKIIVSTDDPDIVSEIKHYPVTIHFRSKENSEDNSSTESVILEVIKDFEDTWTPEVTLGFYQVTSAFLSPETINHCFELSEKGFSAFSAVNFHGFIWEKQTNWIPVDHPSDHRPRRQILNQKVKETGAIYTFPLKNFKVKKYRFCSEARPVIVDSITSLEIDAIEDLKLSNLIATQFENHMGIFTNFKMPKIIFTDFDGCLTNDKVKVNMFGRESVIVNRKDGLAVKRLKKLGIKVVIATAEENKVVQVRAKKLKVEVLSGLENKVESISQYLSNQHLSWSDIWYVGNDVNDLGSIEMAAMSFCPLDASPEVFVRAQVVLSRRGGDGLLAEIASRLEERD